LAEALSGLYTNSLMAAKAQPVKTKKPEKQYKIAFQAFSKL
jgi:hypothetical protein